MPSRRGSAPPNVILFITHETARHFGCYVDSVGTPNLDRLASQGIRLDHCYCTAAQFRFTKGEWQAIQSALLTEGVMPHDL